MKSLTIDTNTDEDQTDTNIKMSDSQDDEKIDNPTWEMFQIV